MLAFWKMKEESSTKLFAIQNQYSSLILTKRVNPSVTKRALISKGLCKRIWRKCDCLCPSPLPNWSRLQSSSAALLLEGVQVSKVQWYRFLGTSLRTTKRNASTPWVPPLHLFAVIHEDNLADELWSHSSSCLFFHKRQLHVLAAFRWKQWITRQTRVATAEALVLSH